MNRKADFIRELKHQGPLDINDVVRWTNHLLPHFVPAQNRYKVSDKVTIRIVRYYLNQALISKPDGYKGRHAQYSPTQVIQILAIKTLQTQYVPLKKIAQIMGSVKESDLLAWLLEEDHTSQSAPSSPSAVVESMVDPIKSSNLSNRAITTLVPNRQWKRVPIHDDIELFLTPGFNLLDHQNESGEILSKIMLALTNRMSPPTYPGEVEPVHLGPAKAIKNPSRAVIALVTEGGLVPVGNPDHLPSARSKDYLRYSLEGLDDLVAGQFESVDRGWDNTHVNNDPDRLLPVDVMRELEELHLFSHLHKYFYSTTGAGTTVENARKIGRKIAQEIKELGISAVIFTAT